MMIVSNVFQGNSLISIFAQCNARKSCRNAFLDYSVCLSWFLAVFCIPLYVVLSVTEYFYNEVNGQVNASESQQVF